LQLWWLGTTTVVYIKNKTVGVRPTCQLSGGASAPGHWKPSKP